MEFKELLQWRITIENRREESNPMCLGLGVRIFVVDYNEHMCLLFIRTNYINKIHMKSHKLKGQYCCSIPKRLAQRESKPLKGLLI